MKKKKVLLIHHSGLLGGAGISLYYTWKALEEKYEVSCHVPSEPPELMDFLVSKGLKPKTYAFRLGKITYYSGGNTLASPKFWYHALRSITQFKFWKTIIKNERPDLVFVNSKVLCWMSILFNEVKSVCFVRETIPGNPKSLMNRIMRGLLDKFSIVAFLSEYDADQTRLENAYKIISPDFLDVLEYEEIISREKACEKLGLNSELFNVLFVGGKDPLKGLDVGLKAISRLKDSRIQLIVAGYDKISIHSHGFKGVIEKFKKQKVLKYSRNIDEFIARNNIVDSIKFIGIQSDMRTVYTACDLLIFPMTKPHQARPAFEIGVQKKPVIISDFPNIGEFVINGENGLAFKPNDHIELANAILRLKNDTNLRNQLGKENQKFTYKFHTAEYSVKQLLIGIDKIIG